MPKTVEESLLADHSDQWIDTDCPEAKRLKVIDHLSFLFQCIGVCISETVIYVNEQP